MASKEATANDIGPRPKYYEMDGARLANANRAWLLAFIMAALAALALVFAIAVRLKPPTVIRIGADGEAAVVGQSSAVSTSSASDPYLSEIFVKRFLSEYLNYRPSNVDDHWATALNRMTRNLRGLTLKAMSDNNLRGKIDDDQIQSVFHLREVDPVAGEPLTYLVYGVKDVHHVTNGNEVTDHFVNEYRIRLVADRRSEANPDGLWIAEYSEHPIDGERRDAILSASDQTGNQ
jgi:type IV secretory pathway component VirB8